MSDVEKVNKIVKGINNLIEEIGSFKSDSIGITKAMERLMEAALWLNGSKLTIGLQDESRPKPN